MMQVETTMKSLRDNFGSTIYSQVPTGRKATEFHTEASCVFKLVVKACNEILYPRVSGGGEAGERIN